MLCCGVVKDWGGGDVGKGWEWGRGGMCGERGQQPGTLGV